MAEPDSKVDSIKENTPKQAPEKENNPLTEPANDTKGTENAPAEVKSSSVVDIASSATTAVKDNVFSMFGGGPKKEKKEAADDVDEPSGSSKAKAEDVSAPFAQG